jgi:hypothetical protein
MSWKYVCPDRRDALDIPPEHETSVALVNSGGVHRTLICTTHNTELVTDERVETEFIGFKDCDSDYQIVEDDHE